MERKNIIKQYKNPSGTRSGVVVDDDGNEAHFSLGTKNKREADKILSEPQFMKLQQALSLSGLPAQVQRDAMLSALKNRHRRNQDTVTLEQAADLWKDAVTLARSESTISSSLTYLHRFLREFKLEKKLPQDITAEMVDQFVNPKDGQIKRTTRRRRLYVISTFLDWCMDPSRMWVLENVVRAGYGVKVKAQQMTQAQRMIKSPEPWTQEAWDKFMRQLDHDIATIEADLVEARPGTPKEQELHTRMRRRCFWKVAATVAIETGLRLSDIANLEWESVKIKYLYLYTKKTDTPVQLEMTDGVKSALASVRGFNETYVFPDERDMINDPSRRSTLSKDFAHTLSRYGLSEYTFHGLRHTYAMNHRNEWDLPAKMGHASGETTKIYTNH